MNNDENKDTEVKKHCYFYGRTECKNGNECPWLHSDDYVAKRDRKANNRRKREMKNLRKFKERQDVVSILKKEVDEKKKSTVSPPSSQLVDDPLLKFVVQPKPNCYFFSLGQCDRYPNCSFQHTFRENIHSLSHQIENKSLSF